VWYEDYDCEFYFFSMGLIGVDGPSEGVLVSNGVWIGGGGFEMGVEVVVWVRPSFFVGVTFSSVVGGEVGGVNGGVAAPSFGGSGAFPVESILGSVGVTRAPSFIGSTFGGA